MADPTRRQIAMIADEVGITDHSAAVELVRRAFEVSRSARAAIEADGPIDDLIPSKYRGWEITVYRDGAQAGYRAAIARYGPKPEGGEPASVVEESIDVEQVAQQVFEAMRFSGATSPAPPEWVPGGNSLMQDHARDVARAILTRWGHQPAPAVETDAILALAAIIREVDGNHSLGAAALAEAILSHRDNRWGHQPAPPAESEVAELVAAVQAAYSAHGWVDEKQFARLFDEVARLASVIEERCDCSVYGPINWKAEIELLRQSQPTPPAEGEVGELVAEIRHFLAGYRQIRGLDPEYVYSIHPGDAMEAHIRISRLARAADLLECQPAPVPALPEDATVIEPSERTIFVPIPEPVPVSDRLPGPEDCDAEGRCWLWRTDGADEFWELVVPLSNIHEFNLTAQWKYTHWLPAHALPLPTGEEE